MCSYTELKAALTVNRADQAVIVGAHLTKGGKKELASVESQLTGQVNTGSD